MPVEEYGKGYAGMFGWEYSTTYAEPNFPSGVRVDRADKFQELDGLRLNTLDTIQAEFKLSGNTVDARSQSVAAILGVSGIDLTKLVMSYLGKVANDGNKWSHREDCEHAIYRKLLASKEKLQGVWGMVAQAVRWAFQTWWQSYKAFRNVNELTAISLEREKHREDSKSGILDIPGVVDFTGSIHATIDTRLILDALPAPIREILQKRLTDSPLTDSERKRWSRFIAHKANIQTLLGLINGSLEGKPKWVRGRGTAIARMPAPERPKNGPVIIIQQPVRIATS